MRTKERKPNVTNPNSTSLLGDLSGLWYTRNGSFVILQRHETDSGIMWKGWILGAVSGKKISSITYAGVNYLLDKGYDLMIKKRGEESQSLQRDFVIEWPIVAPRQNLL